MFQINGYILLSKEIHIILRKKNSYFDSFLNLYNNHNLSYVTKIFFFILNILSLCNRKINEIHKN